MKIALKKFDSDRRFGVEFEFNRTVSQQGLSQAVQAVVGREKCRIEGWHYDCGNKHWVVKTDASCGDQGNRDVDGGGFEVASSVGKGSRHLGNINNVAKSLEGIGAVVNNFCGVHCQVEIKDFSPQEAATLLAYWCKIEPLVSHMLPRHRVFKNHHCKLWSKSKKFTESMDIKDAGRFWEIMQLRELDPPAKRTAITLVNYQRTMAGGHWAYFDRPTVELRLPEGTSKNFEVKNWARWFIQFVNSCKGRPFPKGLEATDLQGTLEILGLKGENGFAVLSPGLYETKAWFLYRLYKFARLKRVRAAVSDYWKMISIDPMYWTYEFPQVSTLEKTMLKEKAKKAQKEELVNSS